MSEHEVLPIALLILTFSLLLPHKHLQLSFPRGFKGPAQGQCTGAAKKDTSHRLCCLLFERTEVTEGSEAADPGGILWHGPSQRSSSVGAVWCDGRHNQSEGEKTPMALLAPVPEEPESLTTVK